MSTRIPTGPSTNGAWAELDRLRGALEGAEAVVIGAGAGLSAAAGLTYAGERFERHFGDFIARYGLTDMYTAGFYPFPSPETYWAYWSRHIDINRYHRPIGQPYRDLLALAWGRDYFVLTTNVDHCFQDAGFDKERLFYTQGDYGLWQCARPCHERTYDNRRTVLRMVAEQRDLRVPFCLAPRCPVCGGPMAMNLRSDDTFVQDEGWHAALGRYEAFLRRAAGRQVLYLELGVGGNTPGIIKYPFWRMTLDNPRAVYACVNLGEAYAPRQLAGQAVCIDRDIAEALSELAAGARAAGEKIAPGTLSAGEKGV